jgi:hypothetical protein
LRLQGRKPVLALGLVGLLTLGVGCGGEGDEAPAAAEQAPAQVQADAEVNRQNGKTREEDSRSQESQASTPEEREAKRTAVDFYGVLAEDEAPRNPKRTSIDTTSFCELMSEEAVAQTVRYAEVSSGLQREWDCDSAVEQLVLRSKRTDGFRDLQQTKVLGINVAGERATATIQLGGGTVSSVPLVKEDGEWKLAPNSVPVGQ